MELYQINHKIRLTFIIVRSAKLFYAIVKFTPREIVEMHQK